MSLEGESELTGEIFLNDTVKPQWTHDRSGFKAGGHYQGNEKMTLVTVEPQK